MGILVGRLWIVLGDTAFFQGVSLSLTVCVSGLCFGATALFRCLLFGATALEEQLMDIAKDKRVGCFQTDF